MKQPIPTTTPAGTSYFRTAILFLLFFLLYTATSYAQISVTATAGTTGPTSYSTLKGAFDAINLGTHQGEVTVTVTSNTTETATAALNASGTGSASFTKVLVQPAANTTPTISGSLASLPIIKLNGASNVMINGSNNNSTSRDLTISNTNTTGAQVLVIGSVGTTPVTADTLKNCIAINGTQTSSAIIASDAASPGVAGYFNNIGIINNSVQKAYIGMYLITVVTGSNGSGTYVADNSVNSTGANAIRLVGIYLQGLNGATVQNNNVGNFESLSAEFDRGIWTATGTNNTVITGNTVTGLLYNGVTAGYAPIGINISPAVSNANITVSGNTVNNISSISTGNSIGIYFYSAASGATIEKNLVSNIKNTNTGGYGAAGIFLAGTLTASAVNVLNNFVWDIAGYGTNLWTAGANGNGIVADGGGGYNIYFNSVWLNTNQTATTGTRAAAVLITSNITTANSINLRNNLLINTQTVGNANSRMGLVVTAANSVMNSFNYNDYYSTSGNLASQGTNATTWSTIAQIQSNMGGNANSVTIQPTFTSATDLHLPVASNTTLNNLGVAITGITTDIDADPRTSTPDMGADEWGNCQTVTITAPPVTRTICENSNTTFSVAATNGNAFQWEVNTGSGFTSVTNGGVYSGATTSTLTITAATAGMNGYTYRAQVSFGPTCPLTPSAAATLNVNPAPSVAVTASGSLIFCTGGNVTLGVPNVAGLTYQWQDASGNISGATNASYTASTTDNYKVTVNNTATGCGATSAVSAVVVGTGPAAVISPSGSVSICQGANAILSAGSTPGLSYQWELNGAPISGANSSTYTTTAAGNYTVVVSTSPTCATTSSATTLNVFPLPLATATAGGSTTICQGTYVTLGANNAASLTYQWLLNGTPISGATAFRYNAATVGNYRVQVTNTISTCKDTSAPITVAVNPLPPASVTPGTVAAICYNDSAVLNANTGTGLTQQWQLNGAGITGATATRYAAKATGVYTVQITDANGCQKVSNAVSLNVHPAPPASITYSSPLEFCEGTGVVLNAYPGTNLTYQWIKDGTDLAGVNANTYFVNLTGEYKIRVTDANNCVAISPIVPVTVFPKPVPVITQNGNTLGTGAYVVYQWYFNNVAIGSATSANLSPAENGAYKVLVIDANGCQGISDQFFLFSLGVPGITASDIQVYPNPATDYFTVENKGMSRLKTIYLINSMGATVYAREALGTKERISTADMASGVYYLKLETDRGVIYRKLELIR